MKIITNRCPCLVNNLAPVELLNNSKMEDLSDVNNLVCPNHCILNALFYSDSGWAPHGCHTGCCHGARHS